MGAFNITTSAGALSFGAAVQNPTNQFNYTSQTLTVNAGTYTLIESDVPGYAEGTWSCTRYGRGHRHLQRWLGGARQRPVAHL